MSEMNKKAYFAHVNRESNTILIRIFIILMSIGIIVVTASEFSRADGAQWSILIPACLAFLILPMIPVLLRKFRVQEYIITHVLGILYVGLLGLLFHIYLVDAGSSVWPMGLLLIILGIFYANRIVWIYALCGTAFFLGMTMYTTPFKMINLTPGDHIGRFGILLMVAIVTFTVHRLFKHRLVDNMNQMEAISQKNEENKILLDNIRVTVKQLNELSGTIGEVINQSSRGLAEIAATMEQINSNAIHTVGSIERVNNNMELFNQNVQAVFDRVAETNELNDSIRISSHTNRQHAAGLGITMGEINNSVQDVAEAVTEFHNSTGMIQKIVQNITRITQQTRILSINASIEASRAGVTGHGFTVIAREVRELAEQSNKMAGEVSGIIENIQLTIHRLMTSIGVSIEKVEKGVAVSGDFITATENIDRQVDVITKKAKEIAVYTDQQKEAATDINQYMEQVSHEANETSAGVQGVAAVVEEMNASMEEINTSILVLQEMVQKLNRVSQVNDNSQNVAIS